MKDFKKYLEIIQESNDDKFISRVESAKKTILKNLEKFYNNYSINKASVKQEEQIKKMREIFKTQDEEKKMMMILPYDLQEIYNQLSYVDNSIIEIKKTKEITDDQKKSLENLKKSFLQGLNQQGFSFSVDKQTYSSKQFFLEIDHLLKKSGARFNISDKYKSIFEEELK